jgi:hypothetical protein
MTELIVASLVVGAFLAGRFYQLCVMPGRLLALTSTTESEAWRPRWV